MRILIADDDAAYRMLLCAVISACDAVDVIGEAVDGKQAVDLAAHTTPDAVLRDVEMRVMDGFEAAAAIRRMCPDARLVLHSRQRSGSLRRRVLC